ncbi:MAG TPA: peptide ABC transporter substrate-binding protein [Dehalococcoidia bacterium]|nr:peptide ABC transporter substrate-binding protein [Dehalococcoidia bacterium]
MRRLTLAITALIVVLVVAIGAIAVVMAGRGGNETAAPAGQGTTPRPGSTPRAAQPRASGELRLLGDDPPTLDPHLATDVASATYITEIFGGLVTIDKDLKIIPDIAERWEASPDGMVYTFFLRRDVTFHSNRGVTAQDFKFSIERAAEPRTLSPTAAEYLGDIVGVKDKLNGRAREVRGVEVIADYTLRITIDAPKPYFLAKLTYPTAFVVDREQVERNPRWTLSPNGTGPFRLLRFRPGERIELVRNPRYHLGAPALEKVTFLLAGGSAMTMYENNEIDVTGVSLLDIERVQDPREALNKEYKQAPSLDTFYIGFNVRQAPFDDLKVRQALAMAIDKKALVETVFKKAVVEAKGVLPPGMPGYNPNLQGATYDPARARQLLQESRYWGRPDLNNLTLYLSGQGPDPGLGTQAILKMWEDNLGLKVNIQQAEFGTFLQDLHRGRYSFFELGWIADYVDPEDFLDLKFYGQSKQNETQYDNPQVNRLLEQARIEQDPQKRYSLYQQVEQIIVNDVAWIPLFHSRSHALIKPYVKDYPLTPMAIPRLRYVRIEK